MKEPVRLSTPLTDDAVKALSIGDSVVISGYIYTGRDAAHKRLVELIDRREPLPFDLEGAVIYYVGPSPAPPGRVIGAAGPTTSYRMDAYAPRLIELGLKGMIGKGARSREVRDAMVAHSAVYFAAIGGAGALMARSIKEAEVIAWEELGPEAVRRLLVEDFPLTVVNDVHGRDLYEEGVKRYQKKVS